MQVHDFCKDCAIYVCAFWKITNGVYTGLKNVPSLNCQKIQIAKLLFKKKKKKKVFLPCNKKNCQFKTCRGDKVQIVVQYLCSSQSKKIWVWNALKVKRIPLMDIFTGHFCAKLAEPHITLMLCHIHFKGGISRICLSCSWNTPERLIVESSSMDVKYGRSVSVKHLKLE